ncbi:Uncharacterized protein OBRU01_25027 [Operophtera brumata]|uniref:Leucine-rich repeat-containing protein 71 n=1 Tax=Operophtera brumata TaxID=104452 RepID=A0A0L7KI48_OPEBR|nr:Uncharacterized protein OBRU01_25027 [Operophtera brumata]
MNTTKHDGMVQENFRVKEYVTKADDKSKKSTKTKSAVVPQQSTHHIDSQEERDESGSQQSSESGEIVVTAVQDSALRLVELSFDRCKEIPRLLMQIIALCVPYQPYLTRLTVRRVPFGGEALYEIAKLLSLSHLTDVCLDDSPVREKNYHSLLEQEQLRCLSLARCSLDDDDCVIIAAKLAHPLPASRNITVLSLVSNIISDVGACALAEALRSNRKLQHLNLAGNRVSDAGACALFRSMTEFPLTYGELIMKRQRIFQYLQLRKEVYLQLITELTASAIDRSADESSRGPRRRTAANPARGRKAGGAASAMSSAPSAYDLATRAEFMANEQVGSFVDPFSLEETVTREGYVYSLGNTTLCFLNLAYNDLGYASVVALRDVLQYQGALVRKTGLGLVRVVLDGNLLPAACNEYSAIQDLLERALSLTYIAYWTFTPLRYHSFVRKAPPGRLSSFLQCIFDKTSEEPNLE